MAVLEHPHQHAERRAERQHVHHDRLQRHDHRPGHQEQQHERRRPRRCATASGSRRRSTCAEVDDLGRVAADRDRRTARRAPGLTDDRLRGPARSVRPRAAPRPRSSRRARRRSLTCTPARRAGARRRPRQAASAGSSGSTSAMTSSGSAVTDGEPRVDRLGDLPGLGRPGQGLDAGVVEAGAGERAAARSTSTAADDQRRPATPGAGSRGPAGRTRRGRGAARAGAEPVPEPRSRPAAASAQTAARRARRRSRPAERPDRRVVEHEQRGERDGHRRAPRTRSCGRRWPWSARDRSATSWPRATLLPEAADDEQPVVDAEPEARA